MTTHNRMSVLRMMGNMETAARDAAISDGEKVSVTRDGTIRERAVSVTYRWSRRKDGAGLERWTWRLDGKRMNSEALSALLESLPVAVATGAAVSTPIAAPEPVHTLAGFGNVARINLRGTSHLYRMGTDRGPLDCEANTRTQAAALAKRFGYTVNDCNMIG